MECPFSRYFIVFLCNLMVFSIIYLMYSLLSFAPIYTTDSTIVVFGFISILTLIGCMFGYVGCLVVYPSLLLICAIINSIWCTSCVIYLALYIGMVDSSIDYYPLHHTLLFVYFVVSFGSVILASILIVSAVSKPIEQSNPKTD